MPTERAERMSVGDAGERYVASREALGRSPTTVEDYGSIVRVHFEPFFGSTSLDKITSIEIERYMAQKRREVFQNGSSLTAAGGSEPDSGSSRSPRRSAHCQGRVGSALAASTAPARRGAAGDRSP